MTCSLKGCSNSHDLTKMFPINKVPDKIKFLKKD